MSVKIGKDYAAEIGRVKDGHNNPPIELTTEQREWLEQTLYEMASINLTLLQSGLNRKGMQKIVADVEMIKSIRNKL